MRYLKLFLPAAIMVILAGTNLNAQNLKQSERNQLLDNDWKFFLGDDAKAGSIDFKDNTKN